MTFPLDRWLKAIKRKSSRAVRKPRRASRATPIRFVPLLEVLEDRTLLSVLTVLNNSDSGVAGDGSLRGEIAAAQNGDTITFAPALAGQTIKLTSGELLITQNISIVGLTNLYHGPNVTIDGNHNGRVFDIENSGAANVTLSNLTITHGSEGSISPDVPLFLEGGGLLINTVAGTVTLDNVTVTGNNDDGNPTLGVSSQGGGVAFLGGSAAKLVLEHGYVESNRAGSVLGAGDGQGGGVFTSGGAVSLTFEWIQNNTAQGSFGDQGANPNGPSGKGGLGGMGGTGGPAQGGGLYVAGSTVTLTDTNVSNNKAQGGTGGVGGTNGGAGGRGGDGQGGGIYVAGGTVSLADARIDSSTAQGGVGGQGGSGRAASFGQGKGQEGSGGAGGEGLGGGIFMAGGIVNATSTSNPNYFSNPQWDGLAQGGRGGISGNNGPLTSKAKMSGGNGGDGGNGRGGSLYVMGGTLAINNYSLIGSAIGAAAQAGAQGIYGGNGGNGGNGGAVGGGSLYVAGGTITLSNDLISDYAHGGEGSTGGSQGTPKITKTKHGSTIKFGQPGNAGAGGNAFGGGLYVAAGTVTLTNDLFDTPQLYGGSGGNGPTAGGGGGGGGGNVGGGGLYVEGGIVTLTNDSLIGSNVTHEGNDLQGGRGGAGGSGGDDGTHLSELKSGGGGGGGGYALGGGLDAAGGTVLLSDDTLVGNSLSGGQGGIGGSGGNVYNHGNTLFIGGGGNGGSGGESLGGGLYVDNAAVTLANTLIAQNSVAVSAAGQGGFGKPSGSPGIQGGGFGPAVLGAPISSDHDLIDDNRGFNPVTSIGDLVNINPDLGSLQNNGGPTETMALLSGSQAINAGDNNAPGLPATDQRGYARIVGPAVDMGAYEYGATPATTDLSIAGNATPATVSVGGQITYNLTVTNNSSTDQSNVTLTDVLPANTTLVSWTPAPSNASVWTWSSSGSGGSVSAWTDALAANTSATFTLVVKVNSGTVNGTAILNTASVGPISGDPTPADNSITFNTTVQQSGPVDVSSDVTVTHSGFRYSFMLNAFVQTLTITADTATALSGSLALQLTHLSSNATLANASGTNNGDPYLDFLSAGQSLATGQSITVTLLFQDPTFQAITYDTEVMQGI